MSSLRSHDLSFAPTHELGANADRYSLIAVDLHHLLLAGLPGAPNFLTSAPLETRGSATFER